jgi:hypothetical protein
MQREFDLSTVRQFIPQANGYGIDAIVTDPNDTSRVATETICTTFTGKNEFVLQALEYYRTHAILNANQTVRVIR